MRQCFVPGERVNKRKERSHKLERDNFALFQNKISNCANNIFFYIKYGGNSPGGTLREEFDRGELTGGEFTRGNSPGAMI